MPRVPHCPRHAVAGFTLVELMVALGVSVILAVVLMRTQGSIGQERMQSSDTAERDSELRAAMDVITQDASGSAYLFGNMTQPCDAIFSYNGATATPMLFTRHPIDAVAASNGSVMGFASNLTLDYPTDGNPSDVLIVTASNDASLFNDLAAPQLAGDPASTQDSLHTGVLQLSPAGSATAAIPVASHVALVEAAIPDATGNSRNACFRVPIFAYDATTHQVTSTGSGMPSGGYAGFQPALDAAGFGTLGAAQLLNGPKFVDIGAPANPSQSTIAYYVDQPAGSFPILMRAQFNLLDDTPYQNAPAQQIAAGVVSLQVRFNVGGPAYLSAKDVTAAKAWGQVCSVRIAVISRSINDDPDEHYQWTPTAITPGSATTVDPGGPFAVYTIPQTMLHRHYLLQTTELAVRNTLLPKAGTLTCA